MSSIVFTKLTELVRTCGVLIINRESVVHVWGSSFKIWTSVWYEYTVSVKKMYLWCGTTTNHKREAKLRRKVIETQSSQLSMFRDVASGGVVTGRDDLISHPSRHILMQWGSPKCNRIASAQATHLHKYHRYLTLSDGLRNDSFTSIWVREKWYYSTLCGYNYYLCVFASRPWLPSSIPQQKTSPCQSYHLLRCLSVDTCALPLCPTPVMLGPSLRQGSATLHQFRTSSEGDCQSWW